ncbi:MAG: hypothetical protein ACLPYS_01225 [Vulcanimicrobiaceae bacterium]|jgi:hypothetical protein
MTCDLPQLGEFERRQIEHAIAKRERYRYVRPAVRVVPEGILVESPCCSRRVNPAGGMVDVALLQRLPSGSWQLYFKDHSASCWKLHSPHARLADALDALKSDPDRLFWQ